MAKYADSPDLYIKKGKRVINAVLGQIKAIFRAFSRLAIYLPVSLLGTLKTAYFRQKRKVPNFSII